MRLWVDTGHMGSDSGALGGGMTEVKRNDALADEVERLSRQQGWIVGATDESKRHTLAGRVADAKAFRADLFVSIHHDWTGGAQAVIYQNTNDAREVKGRRLAGAINRHIYKTNDGIPSHGIYADRRGLVVLKNSGMPAVIIEAARVQDPYVVTQMATWIVQGICEYLGVPFKGVASVPTPPKPSPVSSSSQPVLRMGMRGDSVSVLQRALNAKGEKLSTDGIFGTLTFEAVRRFQKSRGLVVDGVVGPRTWMALSYSAPAKPAAPAPSKPSPLPPTLKFGSKGDWVRILQRKLGVTSDGIFGNITLGKVRAFQKSKGLRVDGIVGPATWGKLGY
jgi:peptidoglycan hydrolase-like protein with peptidoglycan-binding domain